MDRTEGLARVPGVEQVFCFENRGVEIGVTLHHPHGQIYAYPFVTPRTRSLLAAARRHAERTGGRNLYADVLAAERAAGERVRCPLLALWGKRGAMERLYDVLETWREMADDVHGRALECGHFLPEEAPEETLAALREFLRA